MNLKPDFSNLPKAADLIKAEEAAKNAESEVSLPQGLTAAIYGNSPYLSRLAEREKPFLAGVCAKGFDESFSALLKEINAVDAAQTGKKELMAQLRQFKNRASLLVAVADISKNWVLEKITHALTEFADATLQKTVEFLFHDRFRQKFLSSPSPQGFFVLAVGKQGSFELNYSSDIDLIVLYDEKKTNYTGKLSMKEFYVRITQELVEILQQRTAEGYVFRVDLRLRPDPYSTPVAVSTESAVVYYKTVGQNWERAAMIKARYAAGDEAAAKEYLEFLEGYIWRKNLDFKALEDVRSVKRQIDAKTDYKPESVLGYNIKLGKGGIREIEFFAQTQQLIWGGRKPELRAKPTCEALLALAAAKHITQKTADELIAAYEFYRTIEHRLQMVADEHTHSLPATEPELARFAVFLGYDDVGEFKRRLTENLRLVQSHYARLFEESPNLSAGGNLVFTGVSNDPETLLTISKMGFRDAERVSEIIRGWHHGRRHSTRHKRVREILTELVPRILQSFANSSNPDDAFFKFDDFLEQITNGVLLFSLFNEKPELIDLVAEIMGNSPWLAANFSRSAALVNRILIADYHTPFRTREKLVNNMAKHLGNGSTADEKLTIIRKWKHNKEFQIGIRLLKHVITHDEAAENLTNVAEIVLSSIMDLAHEEKEYGEIAIIALGKLGMKDLTFGSDLDLVFVYESKHPEAASYYSKLVSRFVQTITALSKDGVLYNVDTRLRPAGDKGAMASSLRAYEKYYEESAWSWEFMALTKARVIYGGEIKQKIEGIITTALTQRRDAETLAADIHKMRQKVAETFSDKNPWDVKYCKGGIFEAEFILQYYLLLFAEKHHDLFNVTQPKVPKLLMDKSLVSGKGLQELSEAYQFLRDVQSAVRLNVGQSVFDEQLTNENQKKILTASLGLKSFDKLKEKLLDAEKTIHGYYNRMFRGSH